MGKVVVGSTWGKGEGGGGKVVGVGVRVGVGKGRVGGEVRGWGGCGRARFVTQRCDCLFIMLRAPSPPAGPITHHHTTTC